MKAAPFRLGLVQMSCSTDPATNLEKAVGEGARGGREGAQIVLPAGAVPLAVLLPERRRADVRPRRADPRPDAPSARRRSPREAGVVIVASLFERRAAGRLPQHRGRHRRRRRCVGLYRKMHIPDDPLYYEKFYFTPGDLGFRAFDTASARVGTLVCWDQWYPEGARLTALAGRRRARSTRRRSAGTRARRREYGAAQRDAWQTIQRAHAIANGVYVAAVNRVGHEGADRRRASSSGAARSWPIRSGVVIAEASRDRGGDPGRRLRSRAHRGRCAATGRSCATAASTPTAAIDAAGASTDERKRTPAALGFRMPAEWEPHAATWIAWPHNADDWPGKLRADPLGLRRDRPPARRAASGSRILVRERARRERGARCARQRGGVDLDAASSFFASRPIAPGRATSARSS